MDPVTRYATDVLRGRIVAGRLVRLACQRHLDDLAQRDAKGLVWKPAEAQAVIDFFAEVLCLPEETAAGEHADEEPPITGSPFVLQPWQQFIVGSLFGWYLTTGYRRFRTAYIETAKGSGKTPICAGILIYILVVDGDRGSQIFTAAVTKDQARLMFLDAQKMVQASPFLRQVVDQKVNNLAVLETGSFLRAISAEKRGLDGKRVTAAGIDELHEHATPIVVNKMRKGVKGRRNALILEPTNAGFDRTSVCWAHHEYSRGVLGGTIPGVDWFAFVCGLDPCAACADEGHLFPQDECRACDDWRTEGPHWLKANPNLGVSLSWQYLRDLVRQAQGMPSEVSDLLRFNFCVWTSAQTRAWNMAKWDEAGRNLRITDAALVGVPCYGGLDLGQTDDFAAWARLWDLGEVLVLKMRFWLPRAALLKYPNRPYAQWERAGVLEVTDGDTTDVDLIEEAVLEDCRTDGVLEVAYDKRFAHQLALHLQGHGITMVDTPQGYALNESIKSVTKAIVDRTLAHGNHPIMTWMMGNAVLRNGRNKEVRLDKDAAKEKIDGPSALVMANARRIAQAPQQAPVYQMMFLD